MKRVFHKTSIFFIALLVLVTLSACGQTCDEGYVKNDKGVCELEVAPDTVAPIFANVSDVAYTMEDPTPDYVSGITASDDVDGDVTSSITVDFSAVDLTVEGTYEVKLSVSDTAGNSTEVSYNIVVTEKELSIEELVQMDIDAVDFTEGISLPTFTQNWTAFYWSSSHPNIVTNQGFIIPPSISVGDTVVTLTARVVNGSYVTEATWDVTVEANEEVAVTSKVSVPFEGTSTEYVVANQTAVDIYYVDNGSVPYIDIETFVDMIDGALESDILSYTFQNNDELLISYDSTYEDFDGTMVTETYTALVDFTDNTFTVSSFDFFESYVAATESDYGDGLHYVDAEYVDPKSVTIPLGEYNFDLVIYDDAGTNKFLMPFQVTNLLFAGGVYYDAYFNGEKIWGIDTFGISGIDKDDPLYDNIRTSAYNDQDMPEDVRWANYHFMALLFDFFYGLKEEKGIDTYYDVLSPRAKSLITSTDSSIYREVYDIAYAQDDLHTSHVFYGYYQSIGDPTSPSLSDFGPRSTSFYEDGIWAMQDKIEAKYGSMDARPEYELIDNNKTAVIHIDGFSIDTPVEFKAILDSLPAETVNVVLDLSYNTGGNIGAVFRIFGYMTEERFAYSSQNPADDSAYTVFIESDYVAYDYNWYIISSKVSFSAANLMIAMAQENNIAKVMGQKSSGGASSIGAFYLPDGTALLISTNNVLSVRSGNPTDGYEYHSVEFGIEPDYHMNDETSDSEIISIIEQDQATAN